MGRGEMPGGVAGWGEASQDLEIHFSAISLGGLLGFIFHIHLTKNNQVLLLILVPRAHTRTHTYTHTQMQKELIN